MKTKKKILLVGGLGFIGHNLALKLKKDYEPIIVDGLNVNNFLNFADPDVQNTDLYSTILYTRIKLLNKNKIKIIIQDARDYHEMSKIYEEHKPSIIIHLAAVSHANKSNKDPHNTFDNSLRTLENTLNVAKNNKTHVIYLSSSMVYGDFQGDVALENQTCNPIGIYGSLKMMGEILIKSYNQVFDLPYTIIRPSALYGERCVSRRVGQIFIENAIQNKKITINGSGKAQLDFTYIDDFIQGVILCCKRKSAINETFNLTYGDSRKIYDLIEIIREKFPKIKILSKKKEAFTPERGTLSILKAKNLLGYKPSFPIDKGYRKYLEWYKEFWKNEFSK